MNILALDSSSARLSLAVKKENDPIFQESLEGSASHVENLMPILVRLLERAKLSIKEVDTCLIGRGPGSFTGLRVGFATLKALQFIQKRNCYGALSLDMMAEAVELPDGSKLSVMIDAYRSKIYYRSYMREQNLWHPIGEPQITPAESCHTLLDAHTYVIGNARSRYLNDLKNTLPLLHLLDSSLDRPHAVSLIRMWDRQAPALQRLDKPEDFIPLYFRLSEAEERKYHDTPA